MTGRAGRVDMIHSAHPVKKYYIRPVAQMQATESFEEFRASRMSGLWSTRTFTNSY